MMKSLRPEEENIIKDKINLFRIKKRLSEFLENNRIRRDMKNLFEHEEEKP